MAVVQFGPFFSSYSTFTQVSVSIHLVFISNVYIYLFCMCTLSCQKIERWDDSLKTQAACVSLIFPGNDSHPMKINRIKSSCKCENGWIYFRR